MTTHRILVAITIAALFTACRTVEDDPHDNTRAARYRERRQSDREEGDRPPRLGMTKDQVINMYGEPTDTNISRRGEVWVYVFNNIEGRDFIPYYGAFHQANKRRHSRHRDLRQ